jgi:hypothetical protein
MDREQGQASDGDVILGGTCEGTVSAVLNRVLWIQYLDSRRACTLFLLLRGLSSEETMSTRSTHDLGCT